MGVFIFSDLMKPFKLLRTTLGYLLIFIILYTAVNAWRAPDVPSSDHLQLNANFIEQNQTVDVMTQSFDTPVLVYFWGTWCGICNLTSPSIQALKDEGYAVISVAISSGSDQTIKQHMRAKGYDFATMNDDDGKVFSRWQGQVTPSFVIISQGKPVQRFTGIAPLWSLKLRMLWARVQQ